MFNIYQHERHNATSSKEIDKQLKAKNAREALKKRNAALGDAYRQRVGEFIQKIVSETQYPKNEANTETNTKCRSISRGSFGETGYEFMPPQNHQMNTF